MGKSVVTMGINNYKKLNQELEQIQKNGETAMKRVVSDMKRRLPGPIASEVSKMYKIDKAEINPTSTKAVSGKEAVRIGIEGKSMASLVLVYRGRVLTPQGHGFTLKETKRGNGRRRIKVKFKNKVHEKELKGKYGTVFLAPVKKGSDVRIPFQRVPSTNAIEVIRTVAVPEMIDNNEVSAAIYKRIHNIVNERASHHFKKLIND